ncbi:hypothetical protein [Caproiciproducens faecalis]|uniref:Coat F domain-containing protein n=1 Tax=Caproiciproducens faecalis TaxID=2820301 RepID=A0ABS7DQD8_9FIRM|nr:hypothetical protein [Caproiciproducens faecalis]MBW7573508.1 hypothetical protein [Caproiciproducens faecalis]
MAMTMDQMQMMMAKMHQQNYSYDMELAKHFQEIGNVYATMAQQEYQMYQMHTNQMGGMSGMSGMQR